MSNKLTETLMSSPETLELFTENQRETFVNSTIRSMVQDEDAVNSILDSLKNNLHSIPNNRIRTEFDYNIELDNSLPAVCDGIFNDVSKYFYIQEKLHYRVKYLSEISNNLKEEYVSIGFMFSNKNLDGILRETDSEGVFSNCIFREILDIMPEDLQNIKALASDMVKFQQTFKVDLQIDGDKAKLAHIDVYDEGIICRLKATYNKAEMQHVVRIIFHMPKRWDSLFEIAIVDPTKAPKVFLSYPEDGMEVEMFPFLSKGRESSVAVAHEHLNGIYDISINNEWIYPISGIVFSIFKK